MAKIKKICDSCGKEKTFKAGRRWGAICNSGHYICKKCDKLGIIWLLLTPFHLGLKKRKKCPVCKDRLRYIKRSEVL